MRCQNNNTHRQRPAMIVPEKIDVPETTVTTLPNGIKLYSLDCSDQEVVRVSFVFGAGTSYQDLPFSASSTANILSEGSTLHTAHEIAEKLDFYGSYYDVSLDRDYVVVTFCSLSKFFGETAQTAREILLMPAFDKHEVEIYCDKRKQRLAMERSKVSTKARELFTQTLFGADHPYGVSYPESLYDDISPEVLEKFYKEHYVADNCFVVCSGMIKNTELEIISALASEIPSGSKKIKPNFPTPVSGKTAFREHKDAVQSAIRIGRLLFPRTHPDFIGMQVVSTILGGYFGSRLVRNLREENGYTYGVFSSMVNLDHSGYIAIATEVATEVTQDAVEQIFREVEVLRTELVPEEELQMVRNIMTGEVMRILDGPFGIADVTIENIENGTDNAYIGRLLKEVGEITPETVHKLANKYLAREEFTITIVGSQ